MVAGAAQKTGLRALCRKDLAQGREARPHQAHPILTSGEAQIGGRRSSRADSFESPSWRPGLPAAWNNSKPHDLPHQASISVDPKSSPVQGALSMATVARSAPPAGRLPGVSKLNVLLQCIYEFWRTVQPTGREEPPAGGVPRSGEYFRQPTACRRGWGAFLGEPSQTCSGPISDQAELLEAVAQGASGNAHQFGGLADVPAGVGQGGAQQPLLHLGQAD